MLYDVNNNPLFCGHCGSTDLYFYDGWLGYESVKCRTCGYDQEDIKYSEDAAVQSKEDSEVEKINESVVAELFAEAKKLMEFGNGNEQAYGKGIKYAVELLSSAELPRSAEPKKKCACGGTFDKVAYDVVVCDTCHNMSTTDKESEVIGDTYTKDDLLDMPDGEYEMRPSDTAFIKICGDYIQTTVNGIKTERCKRQFLLDRMNLIKNDTIFRRIR